MGESSIFSKRLLFPVFPISSPRHTRIRPRSYRPRVAAPPTISCPRAIPPLEPGPLDVPVTQVSERLLPRNISSHLRPQNQSFLRRDSDQSQCESHPHRAT